MDAQSHRPVGGISTHPNADGRRLRTRQRERDDGEHQPGDRQSRRTAATGDCAGAGHGTSEFVAEVWADNWFALYVNGELVGEDSTPITTERSFNAETITFTATYPLDHRD